MFTQDFVSSTACDTRHSIALSKHSVMSPAHETGFSFVLFGVLSKAQLLGPIIGPPIYQEPFVVFLSFFALGAMASSGHWQVLNLGAKVFEEMMEQGYLVED